MRHHPFDILGDCDIRNHEACFPSLRLYLSRERRQLMFAPRRKNYLGASATKASPVARPIPLLAPVIRATLPFMSDIQILQGGGWPDSR